jgi:flagellar L-ring protein FlgH
MIKTEVNMKKILALCLIAGSLMAQNFNGAAFSLYSDIKAHKVGDIITVLIVENSNASRESKRSNSSSAEIGADANVKGNLTGYLPLFGASSALSNFQSGKNDTEQRDRLSGKISATIVEELANGMVRIEGERLVNVNGENNLMKVEGSVRTRDIKSDNTVFSYNIANAKIIYEQTGVENKIAKPGFFQKMGTWVLGAGLLAIAITGAAL